MLPPFCRAVRDVVDEFVERGERWILHVLASKLTGPAVAGYTTHLTQYSTIKGLLDDLVMQYSNVGGANRVLAVLKQVRQRRDEGDGENGLRVQALHNRLLNIYDAGAMLDKSESVIYRVFKQYGITQITRNLRPASKKL